MSLHSSRIYSVAFTTPNGIEASNYKINDLLFPSKENVTELHYSVQEYTDELLELKVGNGIIEPMRDNLGDMWIYRVK